MASIYRYSGTPELNVEVCSFSFLLDPITGATLPVSPHHSAPPALAEGRFCLVGLVLYLVREVLSLATSVLPDEQLMYQAKAHSDN